MNAYRVYVTFPTRDPEPFAIRVTYGHDPDHAEDGAVRDGRLADDPPGLSYTARELWQGGRWVELPDRHLTP